MWYILKWLTWNYGKAGMLWRLRIQVTFHWVFICGSSAQNDFSGKWALLDLFLSCSLDNFNHPLTKSTTGNSGSSPVLQLWVEVFKSVNSGWGLPKLWMDWWMCESLQNNICTNICTNMQKIAPCSWIKWKKKKTVLKRQNLNSLLKYIQALGLKSSTHQFILSSPSGWLLSLFFFFLIDWLCLEVSIEFPFTKLATWLLKINAIIMHWSLPK